MALVNLLISMYAAGDLDDYKVEVHLDMGKSFLVSKIDSKMNVRLAIFTYEAPSGRGAVTVVDVSKIHHVTCQFTTERKLGFSKARKKKTKKNKPKRFTRRRPKGRG